MFIVSNTNLDPPSVRRAMFIWKKMRGLTVRKKNRRLALQ